MAVEADVGTLRRAVLKTMLRRVVGDLLMP
jgi:hypothetical protein